MKNKWIWDGIDLSQKMENKYIWDGIDLSRKIGTTIKKLDFQFWHGKSKFWIWFSKCPGKNDSIPNAFIFRLLGKVDSITNPFIFPFPGNHGRALYSVPRMLQSQTFWIASDTNAQCLPTFWISGSPQSPHAQTSTTWPPTEIVPTGVEGVSIASAWVNTSNNGLSNFSNKKHGLYNGAGTLFRTIK